MRYMLVVLFLLGCAYQERESRKPVPGENVTCLTARGHGCTEVRR